MSRQQELAETAPLPCGERLDAATPLRLSRRGSRGASARVIGLSSTQGLFVVFEGIDGTGKSTQVRLLAEALERLGESPVVSCEPTHGPWGQRIRDSAASGRMSPREELAAFLEDRTEHVEKLIRPALAQGRIVILDRYFYSSVAYQGARVGDPEGVLREMESRFPIPDAIFLLDLDPMLAIRRIAECRGEDPNEFEGAENLLQSRAIFLSLREPKIVVVDATQSVPAVHRVVLKAFLDGPLAERRTADTTGKWETLAERLYALERTLHSDSAGRTR